MKKKVVAVLLVVAVLGVGTLYFSTRYSPATIPMFEHVVECELLEEQGITIVALDPIKFDANIAGIAYSAHFVANCTTKTSKFTLYAYECTTAGDAERYFYNRTGKTTEHETNYSISEGAFRYQVVALSGTKVYCAVTSPRGAEEMFGILMAVFTDQLPNK